MARAFIEINEGGQSTRLWCAQAYANTYPAIAGTYDALRKRIQFRHSNGLLASGAVVETRLGPRIVHEKFQAWLLQPRSQAAA